jgi:hypothetical protein
MVSEIYYDGPKEPEEFINLLSEETNIRIVSHYYCGSIHTYLYHYGLMFACLMHNEDDDDATELVHKMIMEKLN